MKDLEENLLTDTTLATEKYEIEAMLSQYGAGRKAVPANILSFTWIETPLGVMLAIGNSTTLYLLEFISCKGLRREIKKLCLLTNSTLVEGKTPVLAQIEEEILSYFKGALFHFTTPVHLLGTSFQKRAWEELAKIPYGHTRSYRDQAILLGNPTAYRAVANANGANQLAIIIPCHRIINHNGQLGGYDGGIEIKKWLLAHEQSFSEKI